MPREERRFCCLSTSLSPPVVVGGVGVGGDNLGFYVVRRVGDDRVVKPFFVRANTDGKGGGVGEAADIGGPAEFHLAPTAVLCYFGGDPTWHRHFRRMTCWHILLPYFRAAATEAAVPENAHHRRCSNYTMPKTQKSSIHFLKIFVGQTPPIPILVSIHYRGPVVSN